MKLVYTQFINNLTFIPKVIDFFPLKKESFLTQVSDEFKQELKESEKNLNHYELPISANDMMLQILPQFFSTLIYGAILESKVCESGSRYNAMSTATDNADALKTEYELEYNRKRQSSITQEIIEIISGFKSLS